MYNSSSGENKRRDEEYITEEGEIHFEVDQEGNDSSFSNENDVVK